MPLALLMLAGCQSVPTLPVRHVVVYRNGVAFYDRQGRVDGGRVGFRTRPAGVSDVLATLAVSEVHGGATPTAPAVPAVRSVALQPRSDDREGAAETIVLTLDGKPHDLDVGYLAESPIWKPSYRLMLAGSGPANLQIWGVVENASGEDWKDVGLSLVTAAPVAYTSDLDARVVPARPSVTDQGVPGMAIPRGESSYGYRAVDQALAMSQVSASASSHPKGGPSPQTRAQSRAIAASADASRTPLGGAPSGGGSMRYDVPLPVTIADQSASMVMVRTQPVKASQVLLLAPDDAVPESSSHPFRAVRFTNATGGPLESAPVAIFDEGSFLGQGVVQPVPSGGSATVPFALEREVTVTRDAKSDEVTGALQGGPFGATLAREQITRTLYHLDSALDHPVTIVVRHPRLAGARLKSPAVGVEENAALGVALVPVDLTAHGKADLLVEEAAPVTTAIDWLAPAADMAVKAFLADPAQPAAATQKLTAAWAIRDQLLALDEERSSLRLASYDLERESRDHRRPETEARISANARRMAEVESRYATLKTKLDRALSELDLPRAPAR